MTENLRIKRKKINVRVGYGELFFGIFTAFCLLLLLKNSQIAIESMHQGILLCTKSVIPSLFPFMVLSELLVTCNLRLPIPSKLLSVLHRIFGFSGSGSRAMLLGLICGFPVGARCAMLSLERGEINAREATRILCFGSIPSSAFLISAVGVSLWENRRFGLLLYVCVLTVSLLTAAIEHQWTKKKRPSLASTVVSISVNPQVLHASRIFTDAVRNAAKNLLLVCAYVLFFSAIGGTLSATLHTSVAARWIEPLFFVLLELSGGMSRAAALSSPAVGAVLSAFAAGWAGISVHCQILSICDRRGISFVGYFAAKLIQGILCALLVGCLVLRFPTLLQSGTPT